MRELKREHAKLSAVLDKLTNDFPKALEVAFADGFKNGCAITRVNIAKSGEITCQEIPYEEFFEASNTKAELDSASPLTNTEG